MTGELLRGVVRLTGAKLRGFFETLGTQGREVNGGPQRNQTLVGANVAGRLFSSDMLLSRLQGQHPAASTVAVDGLANQAPGHFADKFLAASQYAQVGPAIAHRRTQGLSFRNRDVCAVLSRTF